VLWLFLAELGLNQADIDQSIFLSSFIMQIDSNGGATSLGHEFGCLSARLGNDPPNHRGGLVRLPLAECESALRQHVLREYLLATVDGQKGSR